VTFEALAPWFAFLVVAGILWAIGTKQRRPGHVRQRSEMHEVYLALLVDVLGQAELRKLMIDRGTGTAEGIALFRRDMGTYSYPFLRACAAKLLSDRIVRRQVAAYVAKGQGGDRKKLMGIFGGLVEGVR
jgi:hypothetical protein